MSDSNGSIAGEDRSIDDDAFSCKGPTISFKGVSVTIPYADRSSHLIHAMSGQIDWGRLTAVVGGTGSGKSTLLHVLSGELTSTSSATIHGDVLYNHHPVDTRLHGWQRCGYVGAMDIHYRDLTVREVLTFAMQLRCLLPLPRVKVKRNVDTVVDLTLLSEYMHTHTPSLSPAYL